MRDPTADGIGETSAYEHLSLTLEARSAVLVRIAQDVANDIYQWRRAENAKIPAKKQSVLILRVREVGHTATIEWVSHRFKKTPTGKLLRLYVHIQKNRNAAYDPRVLTRHAQAWELQRVLDTETHLAEIRRQLSYLSKIRRHLSEITKGIRDHGHQVPGCNALETESHSAP